MSPASLLIPAVSQSTTVGSAFVPALPLFEHWSNQLPESFSMLDDRNHRLQSATNKFLEMHPNGTRGVDKRTEYGILTILLVNLYNLTSTMGDWSPDPDSQKSARGRHAGPPKHFIICNKTGMFLCMDDHSSVYQSKRPYIPHCAFTHETNQVNFSITYHRTVNRTKWYIGINKDGSIRCGNVTSKNQKSVQFFKVEISASDEEKPSPPFVKRRKPCCTKKRCGRRRKPCRKRDPKIIAKPTDSDIVEEVGEQSGCRRTYINWCRKHRRQFFKLKLKDLKRYYNRCIKKNRNKGCSKQRHKVRHCPDR